MTKREKEKDERTLNDKEGKRKKGEKTENKGKIKQRKDKTKTMNTKRGIISEK